MKKLLVISSWFMVHNQKLQVFLVTCHLSLITFVSPVHAQIGLDKGKQPGGILVDGKKPEDLFGVVFQNALNLLFTVGALGFIIMFVWGAVDWILSGGDKEKIAGARKRIVTAITGLVVLSLTFAATLVIGQLLGLQSLRQFNFTIPKLAP